ncbi:MAG: L,D-transpeptidase family protein [Novosphingobium sp.]
MRTVPFAFAPIALVAALALSACNMNPSGSDQAGAAEEVRKASPTASPSDPLAAHDPAIGQPIDAALADDQPRPLMQAQVVLDRLGFTPGVVDGKEGLSTRNAVMGFQEAKGLTINGQLDEPTTQALAQWINIPATRVITIPAEFAAGNFAPLPVKPEAQAKLPALGYESVDEKLAERFHTTVETLQALNPRPAPATSPATGTRYFKAGDKVRVPNVGADTIDPAAVTDADWRNTLASLGVGSSQPKVDKIVVSKSKGTLKAYDGAGKLVGMFTATMGSERDPLPLGNWKVQGVARNPPFHYNPKLFWDVSDSKEKQLLPPGPNGPVGVAWIDINKPHYGIHGTPHPETIGRAESHGCVRLTNWDVARLAQMVKLGAQVKFEA